MLLAPANQRAFVTGTPVASKPLRLPRNSVSVRFAARTIVHAALEDPWRVLGVDHSASEKDIKRAHRRLVLQHHPDLAQAGDCQVHARFIAIQEAYEILIGKRRGKEIDGKPSGGWDFHDWYWKFSMKRRRKAAAAGDDGSPPVASMRDQWKSQLLGLKQKAAGKKYQQRGRQEEAATSRSATTASTSSSSVWRSTTKNARASDVAARAAAETQQPKEAQRLRAEPSTAAFTAAAAATSASLPRQEAHIGAPVSDAAAASDAAPITNDTSPNSTVAPHTLLENAAHAVHAMRSRHQHAVHAHGTEMRSQIVNIGRRLSRRLHLDAVEHLLGVELAGHAQHTTLEGSLGSLESELSTGHTVNEGGAGWHTDGGAYHHAAHSRKFADKDDVKTRLTTQLAGLKRRAGLKHDYVEVE